MIRKVPFLTGAFTPLVTPFKSGAVDYDRYAQLIEWQIEQGTHGLLVNATSGEPTTLTVDEKARLIEVAVKTSAARKAVVAGIPSESHADAVTLLARAEKAGAMRLSRSRPIMCGLPSAALSHSSWTSRTEQSCLFLFITFRGAPRCRSTPERSRRSPRVARISSD